MCVRERILEVRCDGNSIGPDQLWHCMWSEVCRKKQLCINDTIQQTHDSNITHAVGSVTTMALAPMDMAAIAARASLQYILIIFRLCDFV